MVMCAIFKLCKFLVKKVEVVKKLMWFKVRKKNYYNPSIAIILSIAYFETFKVVFYNGLKFCSFKCLEACGNLSLHAARAQVLRYTHWQSFSSELL